MRIVCACAILCASALCAARSASAQDMADAARQEKARKAAEHKPPAHVYTNEDLQHAQILTPEDRTIVEARKKNLPPPPAVKQISPADVATQDTQEATATESLGEIARRLRTEKNAREAEQARKLPQPAPFQLDLPQDATLAHPKPLARPLVAPSASPSSPGRIAKPPAAAGSLKRNPFSRAVISAVPLGTISAPAMKSVAPPPRAPSAAVAVPAVAPPATIHVSSASPNRRPGTVQIQPGDSLWNLSRHYLGKGSRWQEWLILNPTIGDPRRMQPGTALLVPTTEPAAMPPASESRTGLVPPKAQSSATISVQPGDSLWRIAATHLGSGADWPCLAQANPNVRDVSLIYPGQTLLLPASCTNAEHASLRK